MNLIDVVFASANSSVCDIYELAAFIATEKFDAEVDPELTLDIEGKGKYMFNVNDDATTEVTANEKGMEI